MFQSLTNLELFFIAVIVGLFIVLWFKYSLINALYLRVNDLQVMNNRFYQMYMQETNNSLFIVEKWQRCADENKELIKQLHSPKNPQ